MPRYPIATAARRLPDGLPRDRYAWLMRSDTAGACPFRIAESVLKNTRRI